MKNLKVLSAVILSGLIVAGCSQKEDLSISDESVSLKSASLIGGHEVVPNEVLVKFKAGTTATKKAELIAKLSGKVKEKILTKIMEKQGDQDGIELLTIPGSVADAVLAAKGSSDVEYAEPNYVYHHDATSNDTYYTNGSLWGMYGDASSPANQFGSQAAEAWAAGHTGSSTVYIGIIDEGYMYTHEDLSANAGINPGEIAGNGVDDDGNGYKDDVYGWDFVKNDNTVYDGTSDDHGTHVAGTIGAKGGNGKGVAGVSWNVKLLSGKFLGAKGGTTANAIKAIDYFVDLKVRHGINLVALNNSWGGGGYTQSLYDAIERANLEGILFIAAAGNDGVNNETSPHYPSSYSNSNIISVASITSTGAISSFSNYGAASVDIGAPGSGIYSTLPGASNKSKYGSYSGTSMATPHVSGAAALYASTHPGATAAQIKAAILNSAVGTASLSGKCTTGGRLNVSGF